MALAAEMTPNLAMEILRAGIAIGSGPGREKSVENERYKKTPLGCPKEK